MKNLLIIFFLSLQLTGESQINSYSVRQDTCLNKKISVVFYVILDPGYVPLVSPTQVTTVVNRMDSVFRRVCISFMNCSTVYIPVHPYGGWHKERTEPAVTASWYTEKALNIYVVDTVYTNLSNTEPYGYSYPPTPTNLSAAKRDLIVIEARLFAGNMSNQLFHSLGTYLGLPHTNDEIDPGNPAIPPPPPGIVTHEFANQTQPNCDTHGDGFCDTEADPGYTCLCTDGMGNFYVLPIDNYMTHYGEARGRYSGMQYYRMVYTLMTKRLYLH